MSACVVSSVYSIVFMLIKIPDILSVVFALLFVTGMTHFALKLSGVSQTLKTSALFIVLSTVLSGIILVLSNIFSVPAVIVNGRVMYPLPFYTIVIAIIILSFITKYINSFMLNTIFKRNTKCEITVFKGTKSVSVTAFLDTGNLLSEPQIKKRVMLCDFCSIKPLLDEAVADLIEQGASATDILTSENAMGYRLVKYSSPNTPEAFIITFTPDKIVLKGGTMREQISVGIVCGLSDNKNEFDAIINPICL